VSTWSEAYGALVKRVTVKQLPQVKTALKLADAYIEALKARKDFGTMRETDKGRVLLVWRAGQTVREVQVGEGGNHRRFNRETSTADELGISAPDAWRWKMVANIPEAELTEKLESWSEKERIPLGRFIAWGKKLAPNGAEQENDGPEPRLFVGRAESMDFLSDELIDIIITSPPYNLGSESWPMGGKTQDDDPGREKRDDGIGYEDAVPEAEYQKWQVACLNDAYRVAKAGASFFYNHKVRQKQGAIIHPMDWLRKSKWTIRQEIVWDRTSTHNHCAVLFWPTDERIYWLTKGTPELPERPIGKPSVWRSFGPIPGTWHPAPFTEELPKMLLDAIGKDGDVILDPFAGSFTTCRVAQALGYESIGVDADAEYVERAAKENGWTKPSKR